MNLEQIRIRRPRRPRRHHGVRDACASGVRRFCLAVAVAALVSLPLAGVATAHHCTGDQSHLSNDECGYWVEAVPAPTPTESPPAVDVRVVNGSPIEVSVPAPLPVAEQNPQTVTVEGPLEVAGGWSEVDAERADRQQLFDVAIGGVMILALAALLILNLPRGRQW
jgi:hypothetical protein